MSERRVLAIILAAGRGERAGGPKALLAFPAGPAVEPARPGAARGGPVLPLSIAHAERRLTAECVEAFVVVRKAIVHELIGFVRPGIHLLASEAPDRLGPAGSLAVAVARIDPADALVVTPVDAIPARPETVAALLARLDGPDQPLAVRPRHGGRGGHPIVVRPAALDRYRQPDPPPLRDHLQTLGARCVDLEVDDAEVLADLDTPTDVTRALGSLPRFFAGGRPR